MKSIPEGYIYMRCDQYSPEEFKKLFTDKDGSVDEDCCLYMLNNPKATYNTDDQIAVYGMHSERSVGSIIARTGKCTTKRYDFQLSDRRGY